MPLGRPLRNAFLSPGGPWARCGGAQRGRLRAASEGLPRLPLLPRWTPRLPAPLRAPSQVHSPAGEESGAWGTPCHPLQAASCPWAVLTRLCPGFWHLLAVSKLSTCPQGQQEAGKQGTSAGGVEVTAQTRQLWTGSIWTHSKAGSWHGGADVSNNFYMNAW